MRKSNRHARRNTLLQVLELESRRLLNAAGFHDHDHDHDHLGDCHSLGADPDLYAFPAIQFASLNSEATPAAAIVAPLAAAPVPGDIPILNSLPGAAASIYLDFDGHFEPMWGPYSNVDNPPFDIDGDPGSFSSTELNRIERIWAQVAEDYAPFQINVTTVEPPSFANGEALRVAIGGNGSWAGGTYGGVSYVNSFTNSIANTAFVFSRNLGNGSPKYTGDAASHEAGHAFGLQHQSSYSATGTKTEYSTGPGDGTAPIMGKSYSARRSLWWYGTTLAATIFQNDIDVIARPANGFGLRPDDHGNSALFPTPMSVNVHRVSASGLIETAADIDAFSFTTNAGPVSFTVATPLSSSNLVPRLELWDLNGTTLLATSVPQANFSARLSTTLEAGFYRIYVMPTGNTTYADGSYGQNVGQYQLSGTIRTPADRIATPSSLIAAAASTSVVNLSWTDNATNETGFRVERSLDGLTWSVIAANLAPNSTKYVDAALAAGTTYIYRVQAFNASLNSDYAATITTTIPDPPTGLEASPVSFSQINLTWSPTPGATGYRVEFSSDGLTWSLLTNTTTASMTSFSHTGLTPETTYHYRVLATNKWGLSTPSPAINATTLKLPLATPAPSNLEARLSGNLIILNWQDNSQNETGFRVERSINNGLNWMPIGQTAPDQTTFFTFGSRGQTLMFRVYAVHDAGISSYSNVVTLKLDFSVWNPSLGRMAAPLPVLTVNPITGSRSGTPPRSPQSVLIPLPLNPPTNPSFTSQALNHWAGLSLRLSRRLT